MILVVGASGTTGSVVLRELLERGLPVRALTRSNDTAAELRKLGAEVAVGDLREPASLWDAFSRVERLYLVTPTGPDQVAQELDAIALAEQAGVYHVVKLGCIGSPEHEEIRQQLDQSSLRGTVIDAASFTEVDPRDVGEVAALALAEEGHEDTTYVLDGPQAVEPLLRRPGRTPGR